MRPEKVRRDAWRPEGGVAVSAMDSNMMRICIYFLRPSSHAGVAISSNGLDWQRGHGSIEGARGEAKAQDIGRVLEPNAEDWWWLDTRHMAVSDVQVTLFYFYALYQHARYDEQLP